MPVGVVCAMENCFCGNKKSNNAHLICDKCVAREKEYLEAKYIREKGLQVMDKPTEQVDHPKHYNTGKFEVIDVIEDWQLDFHIGNVVKYVSRAGRKSDDTEIQDLKKALWYLKRRIEILEKKDV